MMGAHYVVDHRKLLAREVEALGLGALRFVFSTTHTGQHLCEIAGLIAPQRHFALIDDPDPFNIKLLKHKSASVHWEFIDTRPSFGTANMNAQGRILSAVAELAEAGRLRTTLTERMQPINAATLIEAHAKVENGGRHGKLAVEGWSRSI